MANDKIILYGDRWSATALWAKALFLLPFWFYLLIPLAGWILSRLGNFAFQLGYPVILVVGLIYFIDDLLRRKIRIDDTYIHLGLSKYKLAELRSVGLIYSQNGITPASLLLYFGAGNKLSLNLNRLHYDDFEKLLNLIENRVPHCTIDPVITTLCKSKKLARKAALEEADRTEIKYYSRRVLKDIQKVFMETAESWSRLGPALTFVVATPLWLAMVKGVYSVPLGSYSPESTIMFQEQLINTIVAMESAIGKNIGDGISSLWTMVSNPAVALVLLVCLTPIFYQLMKLLLKPNRLVMDASGAQLNLKLGRFNLPVSAASWKNISAASLVKPTISAGPDHWLIQLRGASKNKLDLELAALTPEDRSRFSRALERWAPHCAVDTALMETLMPRQAHSYTELWLQSLAAPPERQSLEPLSAGRVLHNGQFEVQRRIGVGGQGAAYLCTHHVGDTQHSTAPVVLKETIIPVFVEAEIRKQALERFEQEARILRDLESNHIVKLLDYFVEDHRGYLVLEWVDGKSLRQIIEDRGAMPEDQVKELAAQMCTVLDYLHSKGIIHRDFTPDNLILQKDGTLKLIDFNVAQNDEEGTGLVVGKQAYMPAEQFRGKPTAQSDIYAMGATLFYMLTGQDPEPITQSRVRETQPAVSETMDSVIQGCTAADCGVRYKSVDEIASALSVPFSKAPVESAAQSGSDVAGPASSDDATVSGDDSGPANSSDIGATNSDTGPVNSDDETVHTIKIVEKEALKVDA
ncbi:MAG: protein kinase [Cyanobacteria bacterium SZAS LIN-5]|nr:protein kinase [Cyanobacteria bacterium SZAS LIN-5]